MEHRYPYIPLKGDDKMSILNTPLTVVPYKPERNIVPQYGNTTYPIVITNDNGDGTYQSHLDSTRMSTGQKLMALSTAAVRKAQQSITV